MIFETHAHYEDDCYEDDGWAVIEKARNVGVKRFVNVGSTVMSSQESIEIAHKHDDFYATVGVHPEYGHQLTDAAVNQLREMCKDEKVIAVGEIGFDYYWDSCPEDVQEDVFRRQLAIAKEFNLPVIIHSRDAGEDTYKILKEYVESCERDGVDARGIVHCYGYSPELAEQFIKLGFFIGVGGVVTFKNARKLVDTVAKIGLDHIVVETDCPYMSPEPKRGTRNESSNLVHIVNKIAEILNVPVEEVEEKTFVNACRVFKLDEAQERD
ncbi:MAG: TatD family hydrolase [Lachnospiraceae bacterium]|nr:TatD family hydrolase [Lachnospiraceae bacterium]